MAEPTHSDRIRTALDNVVTSHHKLTAKRAQHLADWKAKRDAELKKAAKEKPK